MRCAILISLALFLIAFGALRAQAQLQGSDIAPGDSCVGMPAGATAVTADADQDGKQVVLICDGTLWNAMDVNGDIPADDHAVIFTSGGVLASQSNFVFTSAGRLGIGTANPTYMLDVSGTGRFTGALDMNSRKITSLATPTADSDAATKAYVDSAASSSGLPTCTVNNDTLVYHNGAWICVADAVPNLTYQGITSESSKASSHTFPSVSVGTPSSDRIVIVATSQGSTDAGTPGHITGVTIGGNAATMIEAPTVGHGVTSLWYLLVPAGTTADINATISVASSNWSIAVWSLTNYLYPTPYNHSSATGTSGSTISTNVNAPAYGVMLGVAAGISSTSQAFSAADNTYSGAMSNGKAGAFDVSGLSAGAISETVTFDNSPGNQASISVVTWQ